MYAERKGKHLYAHYCAVCHGASGEGDGFNAFNLDPRPRNLADSS
ncbi:MAG: c-type cytochrome [bacterium]